MIFSKCCKPNTECKVAHSTKVSKFTTVKPHHENIKIYSERFSSRRLVSYIATRSIFYFYLFYFYVKNEGEQNDPLSYTRAKGFHCVTEVDQGGVYFTMRTLESFLLGITERQTVGNSFGTTYTNADFSQKRNFNKYLLFL